MARFRKKPVIIEAIQWTGENREQVLAFCPSAYWTSRDGMIVPTLEGNHFANEGDWIIRGIKGEFYPCKPDVFAATYDQVFEHHEQSGLVGVARGHTAAAGA